MRYVLPDGVELEPNTHEMAAFSECPCLEELRAAARCLSGKCITAKVSPYDHIYTRVTAIRSEPTRRNAGGRSLVGSFTAHNVLTKASSTSFAT